MPEPIDERLAANAVDREQVRAELEAHPEPWPGPIGYLPGFRLWHYTWRVDDRRTGKPLAHGRTVTRWGAHRRRYRAYWRLLNADRRRAVETSPLLNRFRSWVR
jgi:hypothetical protein